MYVVIFKAKIKKINAEYQQMAKELQRLAKDSYGCVDFVSTTEGDNEMALSYWESLEHINLWKNDTLHLKAQELGASEWYCSYTVEISEIVKSYSH